MKLGTKVALLLSIAFSAQAALGQPGIWPSATALLLPMPWVVGPPLLTTERRWYALSFVVGLIWDAVFEPVIGPGAIAWSAAALMAWFFAGVVTDRSPRSWFVLGAVGSAVVALVRGVALFPLGVGTVGSWRWIGSSTVLTGLWCGLVGWIISMDLPSRWRVYRARTLR